MQICAIVEIDNWRISEIATHLWQFWFLKIWRGKCTDSSKLLRLDWMVSGLVCIFKRKLKGDFWKEQKKISSKEPSEWMLNICRRMCFLCSFRLISVWNVYCLCIFIFNFLCYSQFRYHIHWSTSLLIEILWKIVHQTQLPWIQMSGLMKRILEKYFNDLFELHTRIQVNVSNANGKIHIALKYMERATHQGRASHNRQ